MVAVRNVEMPDLLLGIGTIKNLQQAQEYFAVGADFYQSWLYLKLVGFKKNFI
jgi:2-dehydro-3-deoxyphosphogluconate aldolase/(4S)-4-hydroxy-2-oxoglutarate aldolase